MLMPNDADHKGVRRVLIVDDDLDFADSLVDLLASHGYETRVAGQPETALSALEWDDVAVVMLDVRLGGASGVDLLSRLKTARPDLICVMMTAHINTQTAIKALRYGAYDYCDKSCEPSEIFAVLGRCFEKRPSSKRSLSARCSTKSAFMSQRTSSISITADCKDSFSAKGSFSMLRKMPMT